MNLMCSSMEDIQSWWEIPSIAYFCSLFKTSFNLFDFEIEDLEEVLLNDNPTQMSWLQELIIRLLSGCFPNEEISTANYQQFLRLLFYQKCLEQDRYNPFDTKLDFQLLSLRTKVDILQALCDFRLDANDGNLLKNIETSDLRLEPLGYNLTGSAYWYFYGTRLYREDKDLKNDKTSIWKVICKTEKDWFQLARQLKASKSSQNQDLYKTLNENFLPKIPTLFKEKEKSSRKVFLDSLPRRTSRRLRNEEYDVRGPQLIDEYELEALKKQAEKNLHEEKRRKRDLEIRRQQRFIRKKLEEQSNIGNEKQRKMCTSTSRDSIKFEEKKLIVLLSEGKEKQRKMYTTSSTSRDSINFKEKKLLVLLSAI